MGVITQHARSPGSVPSTCNPCTEEVESGGSETEAHPQRHSKFEASMSCRNPVPEERARGSSPLMTAADSSPSTAHVSAATPSKGLPLASSVLPVSHRLLFSHP